ncbi:hypothetical protein [Effusibacillus lacus]|nr:hypothetical protein [Effusibacillus lacus]
MVKMARYYRLTTFLLRLLPLAMTIRGTLVKRRRTMRFLRRMIKNLA